MRFGSILMAYFVVGAVMWGAGLVAWDTTGAAQEFVDVGENGTVNANESTAGQLDRTGGVVGQAAQSLAGPILLVWNLVTGFVAYIFWPVTVLQQVNAPPRLIVLMGGAMAVGFFVSIVRLLGRVT
jgi:hypothetical protein